MSLVISSSQANNSFSNTPIFLDWSPANNVKEFYYSPSVPLLITPQLIIFNVKDVIDNPEFSQYSEFRISVAKSYQPITPFYFIINSPILDQGMLTSAINNGPIALTDNNLELGFLAEPQYLNIFPISPSPYNFFINFKIEGKNIANQWIECSTYTYTIKLFVTNDIVLCNPLSLNFTHYQGTTLPTQTINITGTNWTLVGKYNLVLSSSNPSVTITDVTIAGTTHQIATGTGNADIDITLAEFYDDGIIDPSELTKELKLLQGVSLVRNIPIKITVYDQATLNLSPDEINFYGVKEIQEPSAVHMFYNSANPSYTITSSPWLTFTEEIIEFLPGIFGPVLTVKPISTSNMSVGVYTGFVKIEAIISGTLRQKLAIVTYDLQGFITSPYPSGTNAFTLDVKYFNFFSNYTDTYFQMTAIVKVFDFFTNVQTTETIFEKIPLFNGKAQLNYGIIIHKIMKRFNAINQNYYQYQLAQLQIKADEILIADNSIVRSATLPNVSFVAGLSKGITSIGILDFNSKPSRVTVNSFYYFNILIPGFGYELRVFKNQIYQESTILNYNPETVITLKKSFEAFNQGDVIIYSLNKLSDSRGNKNIIKTFNVIPVGKYSCHITWENEYLLQSILECTGDIAIKSEFENKTFSIYQNFVEVMEVLSSNKANKLTINTGWLTRNDIDTVESLCRSLRVWIELPSKTISLRPITKSITNEDKSRELVEYTLEFQINRQYNEETYSL